MMRKEERGVQELKIERDRLWCYAREAGWKKLAFG